MPYLILTISRKTQYEGKYALALYEPNSYGWLVSKLAGIKLAITNWRTDYGRDNTYKSIIFVCVFHSRISDFLVGN